MARARDTSLNGRTRAHRVNTETMPLPSCASDRPGEESHRTLHVPEAFVANATQTVLTSWATKLCCTFNWIESSSDVRVPYLVTYSGHERPYAGATSFELAAQAAHDDVCGMSMGANDCSNEASCVADAEALLQPPEEVCCMAVPVCPMQECWAGFNCYEVQECCDTLSCQGPAPLVLIIVAALLVAALAAWLLCCRLRRTNKRPERALAPEVSMAVAT